MVIKLSNVHIEGCAVGVKADGPVQIEADNVTFNNVPTPWDLGTQATGSIKRSKILNDPKTKGAGGMVGWRRPKGPPLPVFCPNCKAIFASQNHVFSGQYWSLWGNEEPCIKCGFSRAKLAEGEFNLLKEFAELISGPLITADQLAAIREEIERGAATGVPPDQILARLTQFAPLQVWINKAKQALSASAIISVIGLGLSYQANELSKQSLILAQQQTSLAIEQTQIAREQAQNPNSSDKILEGILAELKKANEQKIGSPTEPSIYAGKTKRPRAFSSRFDSAWIPKSAAF